MTTPTITVYSPVRQLLTLDQTRSDPENPLGIVPDAAVAVEDGLIAWAGPACELPSRYAGAFVEDCGRYVVLPGFIDSHTHLVFAGNRAAEFRRKVSGVSYQDIAREGGGILATVRSTRAASVDELVELTLPRLAQAQEFGVTTMEVKTGYGLDTATELKQLRAVAHLNRLQEVELVPTFMGAHDIPPEYQGRPDAYVDVVAEEMIPAVAEQGVARFIDVFCENGWFTPEQTRRILRAGADYGLKARLHADEFTDSHGAQTAADCNAYSADHLMAVSHEGVAALAEAGVVATLLPGTTLFLGKTQFAPARALLAAGVDIAVASDFNPGSCMSQNLPLMASLACMQMRLPLETAVTAITRTPARSLDLADRCGCIAPGYQADLVGLAVPQWEEFLYHFGVNHAAFVVKRGIRVTP